MERKKPLADILTAQIDGAIIAAEVTTPMADYLQEFKLSVERRLDVIKVLTPWYQIAKTAS